mmetsp:Transcript_11265/g.30666  ORF Transcript_11265/g.30666 Transcript_11265/m.30666 type:complete len:316 (-) Transcript_11265:315-1262(-)
MSCWVRPLLRVRWPSPPPRSASSKKPTRSRRKSGSMRKGPPSPPMFARAKVMPWMPAPPPLGRPVTKITSMPGLSGPSSRPRCPTERRGCGCGMPKAASGPKSVRNGWMVSAGLGLESTPVRDALKWRTTSAQRHRRTKSSHGPLSPGDREVPWRMALAFRWKLSRTSAGKARAPSRPNSCIARTRASSKTRHRKTESMMVKSSCVGWSARCCGMPPARAAARPDKSPPAKPLPNGLPGKGAPQPGSWWPPLEPLRSPPAPRIAPNRGSIAEPPPLPPPELWLPPSAVAPRLAAVREFWKPTLAAEWPLRTLICS